MIFVLAATHRRILAEGQGRARHEIEALQEGIAIERASRVAWEDIASNRLVEIRDLRRQLADVKSQLARFTGPRRRDAKGHFIKGAE